MACRALLYLCQAPWSSSAGNRSVGGTVLSGTILFGSNVLGPVSAPFCIVFCAVLWHDLGICKAMAMSLSHRLWSMSLQKGPKGSRVAGSATTSTGF